VPYAGWAPLTAFTATLIALWYLTQGRWSAVALDHPNDRSLHEVPVPRTGGIALHLGVLLAVALLGPGWSSGIWTAYGLLAAISLLDDMMGMPAAARLAVHLAACALALNALGVYTEWGWPVYALGVLALGWMVNLYNFMDGADGLAGGMAALGFGAYSAAAALGGDPGFALLNLSISGAAGAFLVYNFPPARIFLGDIGSVPLGFLAGVLGVAGVLQGDWPPCFPLLVFSPFIVDASWTLARRALTGQKIWEAHREHAYQRLVQLGWGHRRTVLAEYAVMLACAAAALLLLGASVQTWAGALAAAGAAYAAAIAGITAAWRRHLHKGAV